jgi:exosome complex RNA-binding protein Csl4
MGWRVRVLFKEVKNAEIYIEDFIGYLGSVNLGGLGRRALADTNRYKGDWKFGMVLVEDGGFVIPGQWVCVAEEYSPGLNVKIARGNIIVSTRVGFVSYDKSNRMVHVRPVKSIEGISLGDQVLVEVKDVQEKTAVVEILAVNRRPIKHKRTAVILPDLKTRQDLNECIGVGDLVIGHVVTLFSGVIGLSIWKNELGSVLPMCSRCGRPLKKKDKALICLKCGNKEKRKMASIDTSTLSEWVFGRSLAR